MRRSAGRWLDGIAALGVVIAVSACAANGERDALRSLVALRNPAAASRNVVVALRHVVPPGASCSAAVCASPAHWATDVRMPGAAESAVRTFSDPQLGECCELLRAAVNTVPTSAQWHDERTVWLQAPSNAPSQLVARRHRLCAEAGFFWYEFAEDDARHQTVQIPVDASDFICGDSPVVRIEVGVAASNGDRVFRIEERRDATTRALLAPGTEVVGVAALHEALGTWSRDRARSVPRFDGSIAVLDGTPWHAAMDAIEALYAAGVWRVTFEGTGKAPVAGEFVETRRDE